MSTTTSPPQPPPPPIRRDWIAKTLAGGILGGTLAFACSGIVARAATSVPMPIRVQLAMWVTPPIWLVVASSVFFFPSGRRAWLWLGLANAAVVGILLLLGLLGGH